MKKKSNGDYLKEHNREYKMSRKRVLWMKNEESYVNKVEIVHKTEVNCSKGQDNHYMKIKEVYDN